MSAGIRKWPRLHAGRLLTVVLIGAFLSFYAAFAIRSSDLEKRRVQFDNTASGYAALIQSAFQTRQQEILALHRFFESSEFVSIGEFRRFIEPFIAGENSAMAVEWLPLVIAGDRSRFETEIESDDIPVGRISDFDAQGNSVRAADRPVYFPIRYSEPSAEDITVIGLDLASDSIFRQAMEKARDTNSLVLVPKVRFYQQEKEANVFRFFRAVYRGEYDVDASRNSNLVGFVSAVYRYADIVEATLSPMSPVGLDVTVSDIGDPESPCLLYAHPSRTRSGEMSVPADTSVRDAMISYRETFTLGDQKLEIACAPAPAFSGSGVFWPAWIVLFGGLLLTTLLAVHLNFLTVRNRKVTALVEERSEDLRESRTRLELALAGADLGYWDWQVQTGEMTFSSRWAEMIGYSPEDLEPNVHAWRQIIHPDDRGKVVGALNRHLEGFSLRFESEYRLRHRDGHYIWVLNRGRIIELDDAGKALRVCGTHLDISARKLANQARDLMTAAVEQFGESLIINNSKGQIQYVNSAFERITGYTRAEVIGLLPHQLPGGPLDERMFPKIVKTVESGKTWQGMVDSRKKDGTIYYENATISPVYDENGNISHHIAVRHDLTDLKRLEEEKQKIEMQYQQAQKLESIGRLAGGVAHDLNNLLGPILGYAEIIMEKTDPNEKEYDKLNVIRTSALRARDVVRQLLAFSRKQSLSVQNVELNAVVKGFQDLLRRTILENIRIEYNLSAPLTIRADSGQLEQILMNLAVNAQDAMPEGGLLVIETAAVELDSGHIEKRSGASAITPGMYAMLQVSDTGVGMDQRTLDQVFEPFFSTKDKSKGTGLGLSMVYGTVKQHDGYIWAYSEPDKGTAFKIFFPLLDSAVQDLSHDTESEPDIGEETVMVVEDDQSVRNMTMAMLSRKGYNVMAADSGGNCLDILSNLNKPVDVLLTDVIMPDMNGKELYSKVAKRFPGMKVIYMSGYTDEIIAHHGVLSGGVHFLQKPFSVRDVALKIRRVIDEKE